MEVEQESIEESKDYSFQALSGMREAISIAKRQPAQVAYESAMEIISEINPEAYEKIIADLDKRNKSDEVRYYIETAEALSTDEVKVNPADLIDNALEEIEITLSKKKGKAPSLVKRKISLLGAKNYFKPRKLSEHKILNHDTYLSNRNLPDALKVYTDVKFVDYKLSKDRYLRLRLLHPDHEETILGSDLIYEQFDLENDKVRFVHVQYKMWSKDGIYLNQGNIMKQIEKVKYNICDSGFCCAFSGSSHDDNYRFPYCSGFLRPTDKQLENEKDMVSSGLHLPICFINKLSNSDIKKITKKAAKENGLSHNVFDELFVNQFIGSRWIKIEELEKFYAERGIEGSTNMIRVHAQEVFVESESQKVLRKGL